MVFEVSIFMTCFNLGVQLALLRQPMGDTLFSPVSIGSILFLRFLNSDELRCVLLIFCFECGQSRGWTQFTTSFGRDIFCLGDQAHGLMVF